MLALTRKTGEGIVIDGPCVIRVMRVGVGRVRLAFIAPDSTNIVREELVDVGDFLDVCSVGDSGGGDSVRLDLGAAAVVGDERGA